MSISFGSISTGLPKDIVQQIVNAEKIPVQKMEQRKNDVEEKKKLLNELITLVEGIRTNLRAQNNINSFRELKVNTNNEILDVTVDKNVARPGNYQVEVVSLAQKSSAMSSGFADKDESYIGVGFIQFTLPSGETRDIYVDSDNASLSKVANLINKDESLGIRASVINDGSGSEEPWRLILAFNETGDEQMAEFPYFYFVDGENDFYLDYEREAHDAVIKLDGFEVELPANKASELIPGLTLNLKKAKPGEEFTIQVTEDIEAISKKVTDLIDGLNQVIQFINKQNQLDEKTNTQKTLGGDLTLQTLESKIRTAVLTPIMTEAGPRRLSDLGITFQRTGLLALDEKKLTSTMNENFRIATQVLVGGYLDPETETQARGFIESLTNTVEKSLQNPGGVLTSRKRGLDQKIAQLDKQIEDRTRIVERKEQMLKDKFARLESTISRIKGQSAGLSSIAEGAGNFSPVQQLG